MQRFCKFVTSVGFVFLILSVGPARVGMAHDESAIPDSPQKIHPILVGTRIPALTLTNLDGSPYDLSGAISEKPAVLIFYRGGW